MCTGAMPSSDGCVHTIPRILRESVLSFLDRTRNLAGELANRAAGAFVDTDCATSGPCTDALIACEHDSRLDSGDAGCTCSFQVRLHGRGNTFELLHVDGSQHVVRHVWSDAPASASGRLVFGLAM